MYFVIFIKVGGENCERQWTVEKAAEQDDSQAYQINYDLKLNSVMKTGVEHQKPRK